MITDQASRLTGPVVLLQGQALMDAKYLINLGIRVVRQRDAIIPPARLLHLQRTISGAAAEFQQQMSPTGQGDVPFFADQAVSIPEHAARRFYTTREAAQVLGISPRQVRRLGSRLGSDWVGSRRCYERDAVEAFAASRATTRSEAS